MTAYKKIALLLLISQSIWFSSSAQVSDIDKAKEYYDSYNYDLAIPYYQKIVEKNVANAFYVERLASCYYQINDYNNALLWYEKAYALPKVSAEGVLGYANTLKYNARYKQAKDIYVHYMQMPDAANNERSRVLAKITACDSSVMLSEQQAIGVKVINESVLNSKYSDWGNVVYKNGLIINSDRVPANIIKRILNPKNKESILNQLYGWTGNSYLKLYFSSFGKSGWEKPEFFDKNINTTYHNAISGISADGKIICFTRTNQVKNPNKISRMGLSKDNFVNRKAIYFAKQDGKGEWSRITQFNNNNILVYSNQHPVFSPDGKYLFFSSDMPGGFGKFDLYYSERVNDTTWGKPVNLGPEINTAENEGFPFIASDGMLYFSSDGHLGLGGLDIYSAIGEKTDWKNVKNLLPPYNSSQDDFGFVYIKDKKVGFFASNREGGLGSDDIYRFIFTKPECKLEGVVVDATTKLPLNKAKVTFSEIDGVNSDIITGEDGSFTYKMRNCNGLIVTATKQAYTTAFEVVNANNGGTANPEPAKVKLVLKPGITVDLEGTITYADSSKLPVNKALVTLTNLNDENESNQLKYLTATNGKYHFNLALNTDYRISAMKDGYLTASTDITTKKIKKTTTIYANLKLDKLEIEKVIVLNNIYYDLNKYNIRPDATKELNKLVRLMQDNPKIKVELSSHTDNRASDEYNLKLSQNRAEAAVKYIVSKGVAKTRIVAKGYGENKPIVKCEPCTEQQFQQNRRTEFKIIGIVKNTGAFDE